MGDTVILTAPLLELRKAFPDAELHVVVQNPWGPILAKQPGIKKIWNYERHKEPTARAKAIARLALSLRQHKFDLVVNFHASPSSSTLAFAMGAKVRAIHFHGHKDKDRFTTVAIPGKGTIEPIMERDMNTLRAIGLDIPRGKPPKIYLEHDELDAALDHIDRMGLNGPLLTIGLGASRPTKCWPIERYAEVAREWIKLKQGSVLAVGSPSERPMLEEWQKLVGVPVQIQTDLGLRQLAAILRQSAVVLGNDSGPRHIAVAVGSPTLTLFGPEHPFEWHPYPQDKHPLFFIDNLACRRDADPGMPAWCSLHDCVIEGHKCMKQIEVQPVLAKLLELAASAS